MSLFILGSCSEISSSSEANRVSGSYSPPTSNYIESSSSLSNPINENNHTDTRSWGSNGNFYPAQFARIFFF